MDIFGNCKRWGSIIFLFRVRAGDIRRPVGTAGISVYLSDKEKYRRSLAMDPYGKKEPASANTVPVLFLLFSAWLIACVGMVGI